MPQNPRSASPWRCLNAATILLLAAVSMQQALAQDADTEGISGPEQTTSNNTISGARQAASANKDTGANKGTLNFVDADIESVIAAVGDYTNTTFIIDPRVKGTLTLVSEKPLTKAQAFQLLGSVLRLRGYTIVSGIGYSKVVPEADAKLQAGPLQPNAGRNRQGAWRPDRDAGLPFEFRIRCQLGVGAAPADLAQQHHQRQPGKQHAGHHRLCR